MGRKWILGIVILAILLGSLAAWRMLSSATAFTESAKYLYLPTDSTRYDYLVGVLGDSNLVNSPGLLGWLGRRMDLPSRLKPGRYEIKRGMSLYQIIKMLRNGRQAPVNLVITKLRTKENLAALAGRKLECDSAAIMNFLESNDSLKRFGLDSNTAMTAVFPDTYTYFWNSSPAALFHKLAEQRNKIWTPERLSEARNQGISAEDAYILASIVEEETNADDEKGNIASVYLNRLKRNMRLQADPTVKFALRDFSLRRIYQKHLSAESPYNTYRVTGLPPGPICTPSIKTLDAVLQAPKTDYLYFVAKSDFSGHHVFSASYREHLKHAKEFQEALNRQEQLRQAAREDIGTH